MNLNHQIMNPPINSFFKNPSLDLWGLRVDEPITMLTDVLVTVICWYAFYKLGKPEKKGTIHWLVRGYFLTMGMATLLGGLIGHSFNYALNIYWKIPGWYVSMFSVAFLERAAIFHAFPLIRPRLAKFFAVLNMVELAFFLVASVATMNFNFVMGHAAYGILIVTGGFHGYTYLKTKHEGSRLFLIGVLWATIGAAFFVNIWAISIWFNHMDMAHVLMGVACWYFYLGSQRLVDGSR
ncbi:MAG: hypothetical protein IT258_05425 [Saprospiraceae bacterium]|nr:hypothetical protein [Saprospiraceae bacterium]